MAMFSIDDTIAHVHLVQSPCYHTAVLGFANSAVQYGHHVVMMDEWSAEATLRAIERFGVTTTHMVPTQFHRLLRAEPVVRAAADTRSLTNVVHGAAPCPPEVKRDDRVARPGGLRVLRRVRGRRHRCQLAGLIDRPGTVGRP